MADKSSLCSGDLRAIDGKDFWIATSRQDLTAEEVAQVKRRRAKT